MAGCPAGPTPQKAAREVESRTAVQDPLEEPVKGILARTAVSPQAGPYEDEEQRDNDLGPERDETDQFNRLVRHLVAVGDRRAARSGHLARRTLEEMTPGAALVPLLVLRRPRMNDACGICGVWSCTGNCWQNASAGANALREVMR